MIFRTRFLVRKFRRIILISHVWSKNWFIFTCFQIQLTFRLSVKRDKMKQKDLYVRIITFNDRLLLLICRLHWKTVIITNFINTFKIIIIYENLMNRCGHRQLACLTLYEFFVYRPIHHTLFDSSEILPWIFAWRCSLFLGSMPRP